MPCFHHQHVPAHWLWWWFSAGSSQNAAGSWMLASLAEAFAAGYECAHDEIKAEG
jgi:hypothetical protein